MGFRHNFSVSRKIKDFPAILDPAALSLRSGHITATKRKMPQLGIFPNSLVNSVTHFVVCLKMLHEDSRTSFSCDVNCNKFGVLKYRKGKNYLLRSCPTYSQSLLSPSKLLLKAFIPAFVASPYNSCLEEYNKNSASELSCFNRL